jgi:hypothetical protein
MALGNHEVAHGHGGAYSTVAKGIQQLNSRSRDIAAEIMQGDIAGRHCISSEVKLSGSAYPLPVK